jgi:hypothetical protein
MPTVVSLYLLNPMLPALAFLFAGLLATLLYLEAPSRARLGLAALLLASIFELKLFTAAHLLGALSLAGALSALRAGDRRLLRLALATAALAAPMTLATWLGSAGRAAVALHPWPYVPGALVRMGLMSAALSAHLEELLLRGRVTAMGLLSYAGFALPLYLLLSAGARVLALPRLLAAVREASRDPFRLALALLVLTGPILSLSLSVTPRGYDERAQYNDAVWFYLDAKHVAWLFVAEALRGLMERRSRRIGALALALVLALSVPSSLQFFAFQAAQRDTQRLPRELLLALRELRARAAPGDVVLASERLTAAVLALNPQRTPELRVFPVYFASPDELADEARALSRFWTAWDAGGLAADFVSAKKARFALVEAGRGAPPAATPLYENSGFRLLSLDAAR